MANMAKFIFSFLPFSFLSKAILILLFNFTLFAGQVNAETTDVEIGPDSYADNEQWQYVIAFPMIWAPAIHGTIENAGEQVKLTVPFNDILDNLNFGIIGEFYAQKGKWLYSLRLDYMRMKTTSETKGLTGPITGGVIAPGHKIDFNLHMAANDLLVGYEAYPGLRLLTGVRQVYAKADVDISPLTDEGFIQIEKSFNLTHSNSFDWLVGATYRYWFNDDWGITAGLDTMIYGDSDRDMGANVQAIYRFGGLHNVWMGYRYLHIGNDVLGDNDVNTESDFIQHGPQAGWAFTF